MCLNDALSVQGLPRVEFIEKASRSARLQLQHCEGVYLVEQRLKNAEAGLSSDDAKAVSRPPPHVVTSTLWNSRTKEKGEVQQI